MLRWLHRVLSRSREAEVAPAGACPRLVVLSRAEAEQYQPGEREACISITDPGRDEVSLSAGFQAVLRLEFDDVRPQGVMGEERPLSGEQAEEMARFALGHRHLERLVVHCTAGASRSPALALALLAVLSGEGAVREMEARYPAFNPFVRTLLRTRLLRMAREERAAEGEIG